MKDIDVVEILLVEDNPDDAEVCIRALKKQNLANKLVWVKDGAEALDFLFATGAYQGRNIARPLKVILLDLKLPKVDGLQVLKTIRSDARTKLIPVVVMTSSTQDEDILRSYQLGVNSYVSKPVQFEAFAQKVSELGLYWLLINNPPIAA